MADAIIQLAESEDETTEKEGVELLADYFIVQKGPDTGDLAAPEPSVIFIPKPNIADMFSNNTLSEVGRNVTNGYLADLDSMEGWSRFVETGMKLVKQEKEAKSTPWEGASNFKSPILMQAALKFSDRASTELLRQEDIVKTAIIGRDPKRALLARGLNNGTNQTGLTESP